VIEVEGEGAAPEAFAGRLAQSLPPLARIDGREETWIEPQGSTVFEVRPSTVGPRERALVPPDAALCSDCRSEMERSSDRRHRYPFTTCTNCGPRFSLAVTLPYDRERISMACFPLCPACRREYDDPSDRRFHAEPVCCPECGPRLWLADPGGKPVAEGDAAIDGAAQSLARGEIVAVKGLGGFQLACRADVAAPVARLRERKARPTKPFAVMVRDLDAARRLVSLDPQAEALLASPRSPVVLAPGRAGAPVAIEVAPGLVDLGVMLPTTPLHVELMRASPAECVVMTSGNAGDEPICRGNREAVERLASIADRFLLHDRDVVRRVDDSVMRAFGKRPIVVRRARGFVPEPLPLPHSSPHAVLAVGPHLQATACLAVGPEAFLSQHVGDLDTDPARLFLAEVIEGLEAFLETRGETIVVDAHPDYASTRLGERLARERGGRLLRVQHHLAHAAAVLAEQGAFPGPGERVAAVILDGTGFGTDGTAWGGEWLELEGDLRWRRLGWIEPVPLVGGEAAVREPWRVLAAALALEGVADLFPRLPIARLVPQDRWETVVSLASHGSWPLASGAGRYFEAAGALLGLAAENGYEGEAAARLEALAASAHGGGRTEAWDAPRLPRDAGEGKTLPGPALLAEAARRASQGEDPAGIAAGLHATFMRLAAVLARRVVPESVARIAVGGGCLVNRLLRAGLEGELAARGFDPLFACAVPPGDGGIAYGQAALGTLALARGASPTEEKEGEAACA